MDAGYQTMSVSKLCIFLTVPLVGLQKVILAFPRQNNFLSPWTQNIPSGGGFPENCLGINVFHRGPY